MPKVSQLADAGTLDGDERIPVADNPSTTPVSRSTTPARIRGTKTIDSVDGVFVVDDPGRDTNGFVFKGNAQAETAYGKGQAFLVLEPGPGNATDQTAAGSVVFRVDRMGNVGFTGGLHVSSGLRWDDAAITQAVWIDPRDNMHGLIISNPPVADSATWDKDFLQIQNVRGGSVTYPLRVRSDGAIEASQSIQARFGAAEQTVIGNVFGFAGMAMGSGTDTLVFRLGEGIIGLHNAVRMPERAEPAAPATDTGIFWMEDNGSGKTRLCVKFATGAKIVLATQP